MIKNINNQPFICLDNYLDIDNFLSLENDWAFLVSSRWQYFRSGIWNAAGHSPEVIRDRPSVFREKDFLYYAYSKANQDRLHNTSIDKHLSHFEKENDKTGLQKYLKLLYKAFDPYHILNLSELDVQTGEYRLFSNIIGDFPEIDKFINGLPFEKLGRITVFYNEHFVPLGHHRDYNYWPLEEGDSPEIKPHKNEFIWLRFDLNREFFLYAIDETKGKIIQRVPIQGYSAFFNDSNWHGNLSYGCNASITIKIGGTFSRDFRQKIGVSNLEWY